MKSYGLIVINKIHFSILLFFNNLKPVLQTVENEGKGRQKTEDRSPKTEVGDWKLEVGRQETEDRRLKWEVGSWKWEVGSGKMGD